MNYHRVQKEEELISSVNNKIKEWVTPLIYELQISFTKQNGGPGEDFYTAGAGTPS